MSARKFGALFDFYLDECSFLGGVPELSVHSTPGSEKLLLLSKHSGSFLMLFN